MALTHIRTVPTLRSFDEAKALEFYVGFLGFKVDWTHRFEPELPLFMQVSRDGIVLSISEHHGDATPGSHVRIDVKGIREFHAELAAKRYKNNRPGLEQTEFGTLEVRVTDPAGNRIAFSEQIGDG